MFKISHTQYNKSNNDISSIDIAKDNYNILNKSDALYEDINHSSTKLLKQSELEKVADKFSSDNPQTVFSENFNTVVDKDNSLPDDINNSNIKLN